LSCAFGGDQALPSTSSTTDWTSGCPWPEPDRVDSSWEDTCSRIWLPVVFAMAPPRLTSAAPPFTTTLD
jgi:hypothetical protein